MENVPLTLPTDAKRRLFLLKKFQCGAKRNRLSFVQKRGLCIHMTAIKDQDLIDCINASLAYLCRELGHDSMERYLRTRYGTSNIERIPISRLDELFGDLYQKECEQRD